MLLSRRYPKGFSEHLRLFSCLHDSSQFYGPLPVDAAILPAGTLLMSCSMLMTEHYRPGQLPKGRRWGDAGTGGAGGLQSGGVRRSAGRLPGRAGAAAQVACHGGRGRQQGAFRDSPAQENDIPLHPTGPPNFIRVPLQDHHILAGGAF